MQNKGMELSAERLREAWENREAIFRNDNFRDITERFKKNKAALDELLKIKVDYTQKVAWTEEKVGDTIKKIKEIKLPENADEYFAASDNIASEGSFNGVEVEAEEFPEYREIVINAGCLLGGFDYKTHIMEDRFRIVSNVISRACESDNLCSEGRQRHPSANFADNNYFFNVAYELGRFKENIFNPQDSRIVLRHPHDAGEEDKRAAKVDAQREVLNHRFPYKFFETWTHRDELIHPIGLESYVNLVKQKDPAFAYGDKNLDQTFVDFKEKWREYSARIAAMIPQEQRGANFFGELSLLISILTSANENLRGAVTLLRNQKAIILYGPPGTGKTHMAKELAAKIIGCPFYKLDDYEFSSDEPKIGQSAYCIVQFHPGYSYEDFIGGIRPVLTTQTSGQHGVAYELNEGIFKKFCDFAARAENKDNNFVMIIDEINRADLSAVLGELLYALEYRGEEITIPHFGKFKIPENIYIIGTMNNVDKSLVTFDLALRRRFAFYKLDPSMRALAEILCKKGVPEESIENYVKRCKELNDSIAANLELGDEYKIGQAYFAKIALNNDANVASLYNDITITAWERERLWRYNLLPLIEEYLGNRMEDYKNELASMKNRFVD